MSTRQSGIKGLVQKLSVPLSSLMEAGTGFRIGNPDFVFILVSRKKNRWTYTSQDSSLKVESKIQVLERCLIITHRLENIGAKISPPD